MANSCDNHHLTTDSGPYWYTANGMIHKRLPNNHTDLLDQAFERRIRVQVYDNNEFGPSTVAVANPAAGTMTTGDIHYGLYRHPSLVLNNSNAAMDSLILMNSDNLLLEGSTSHESFRDGPATTFHIFSPTKYLQSTNHQRTTTSSNNRRHSLVVENQYVCCCTIM